MSKPGRPGARKSTKKGATKGSGGQGRKSLEGKGPTPKAEDRSWHVAGKRKAAQERYAAAGGTGRPGARVAGSNPNRGGRPKQSDDTETVTGRNSVLEALRTRIPATAFYIAQRVEMDDRVKEMLSIAAHREIPVLEVTRPELDRMAGFDGVHQGVALKVPPYEYAHPQDLLENVIETGQLPLLVALDGVTDPRNLGAIIRSTAAFGGQGVIIPQRRSAGVNSAAWKTSAGAAARIPVAIAPNLTTTLKEFKKQGVFVLGLDGDGDVSLPALELADRPVVIVVGSEGKGLSRLVTETCDQIVSIPISAATESLNAGIAASVALYQVSTLRAD
ncbi:MAG TPA: 23S rRNA (guanosine(2251)-2'-O)-methyltransferase RlmB [Microbacterium sp.]|jgi:23S rRNA (guanosine2251-2'-O)-methyltransferase|uniref:23S rRNA (guanosine(2251)-2'-O)-methyltransferase RlmB n=1 Tax=Microbacterium TaxID=33882 RepID=UPI000C3D2E76|nr:MULTISPECIES: 23S rRNA (guanosine(2251)-2'-O)-methyltransferase RlmB [Microbacterium]MEC8761359.1 23S rRNA (guanosine(2251)-2'-O)-methyltransferase RlmB [Actinomycetota bacterium]MBU20744.1 23S rRNA (guanosine(2251)-2'-O)-methyltransferase RlmB [Microbacterium sp.]MCC4266317.1 23S rRNA (guanosine(2251)-2'-O)-methyltransferase RlmB [Microbacterium schleiferi]HAM11941.1 23S rRNA (guanosine(2251)-2'-O)-methyltransferase RlmB [Microbacterium sp.]HBS08461.1 23S rRNA (guanosine(2251)-2'-O)-methyl|tara:strand:- start:8619 stop:9614 length:996 start_codon:yes stop_codon:yes gene_type:complete